MPKFIAGRPCRFAGVDYSIGDEIPEGVVDPTRTKALIESGHITPAPDFLVRETKEEIKIEVPIKKGEAEYTAELTKAEVQEVFALLQITPQEEAYLIIDGLDNEDFLMVLHASDSRRGVQKRIEARIEELFGTKEE